VRILFTSTFGYGHVLPMVPLAKAFRDAGHEVLWATHGPAQSVVTAAGFTLVPAGLGGDDLAAAQRRLSVAAGELAPQQRAAFMFPHQFGEALPPQMVADLLPAAKAFRPDLIIHEQAELGAPLVGALLDVPTVTHSFGTAVPEPFLVAAAQQLSPLWASHGLAVAPYGGCFTAGYLDICPPEVQSQSLSHIATRYPMRPVTYSGEDTTLPQHLTTHGLPLVYLTLGTLQAGSAALPLAVAALRDLPVRVLVTVGPDANPADLGPQPYNVDVERWVPQATLLPYCAVVVSHAGSGTFLGALSAGVPQLCLPQQADQFRNTAGGQSSGAALGLPPDQATPEAIAHAVMRLLSEDSFRTAAQGIAATIAAMPAPDEVVATLTA
jgi:UDP:flavonoid glycosyltransferase YjiC (YdhE family)